MASHQVQRLRDSFLSGKSKPISWRKNQLTAFLRMLDENKKEFCEALWDDLHKNPPEAEFMEIAQVRNEVVTIIERLDDLSCNTKIKSSMGRMGLNNDVKIMKEPLGVVLMISPWNYPVMLTLQPLAGAIAAGNCVLLKPSEISQATTRLIQKLLPKYLDNNCFSVFVGGPKESNDLLFNNRFDMIMYTGGPRVAKFVMQAAANNMTPVLLELGGKNPCYIDKSCNLDSTARCVTWGKWTNAGQICVSPDFVLCDKEIVQKLIPALTNSITKSYGIDPQRSPFYGRIISQRHIEHLKSLLKGVDVVYGGIIDEQDRYFSPTIVTNIDPDAPILREEVFGPILPVIVVENVTEAIAVMNSGEKSLQLSIFAQDRSVIEKIVNETSSGGVTVNDVFMQITELDLPFGGVGQSGMGYYHGNYSFNSFCHHRKYFESKTPDFALSHRYSPQFATCPELYKPLHLKTRNLSRIFRRHYRILFIIVVVLFGSCIAYMINAI